MAIRTCFVGLLVLEFSQFVWSCNTLSTGSLPRIALIINYQWLPINIVAMNLRDELSHLLNDLK